ncbi:LysR family transcriptional regulator [Aliamphritea ceti]|uniref:LysR family transcriptional regulator n=1 Tax=Aliamphritea ceti TaxID=1524258 RepID=UPI0021C2ED72|nr:LysR family transcriptional regulator [Aliamphritea ceti]
MDIKLLEDFVCLATLQNFTAASRQRHVTQSALSRRIKALEEWLGTPLINRDSNGFALTPQGDAFVTEAEAILRRLYNAREAVRALGANGDNEITVAAQNSIAQTFFLSWVKRLETRLDSVYVRLISEKLSDCIDLLTQGHVDYMFCYAHPAINLPIDDQKFTYTTIATDSLVPVSAVAANNKPVFQLPGDISEPVPFVAYTHDSIFGQAVDHLLQDKDHTSYLSRRYENAFSHTLKSMALEGLGFAWLPHSSIKTELQDGRLCRAGGEHWDIQFDIRLYNHHAAESPRENAVKETTLEMAGEVYF